jgi:predicted nucleic-acid-binding Zn-ribbon protein
LIETLVQKNCPKCQSDKRYWHAAGVFLVTDDKQRDAGGFAQAAAVVCPDCGLIEFYTHTAGVLKHLPEATVPTGPGH